MNRKIKEKCRLWDIMETNGIVMSFFDVPNRLNYNYLIKQSSLRRYFSDVINIHNQLMLDNGGLFG